MGLRLLVVAVLILAVGGLAGAYRLRRTRDAAIDPLALPPLPGELRSGNATWVVFTAPYCATCGPVRERIGRLDPTATVVEVDVADRPDLAARYRVRTAPTVLFAGANGNIQARFVGNVPDADLAAVRR
jgi:hypothetical protein